MSKSRSNAFNVAFYFVTFAVIQLAVGMLLKLIFNEDITANATALVLNTIVASAIVIILFTCTRWCPVSRQYLNTRPWDVLIWTMLAALGCNVLSSFIVDMLGADLPKDYVRLFSQIMDHELGYFAIGIIGPVAEEVVFRGAILRTLLKLFDKRMHWWAIFISALLFAVAHSNVAQGVNALLLGMLLGWLYYHTGSIIPGIAFHWSNNTIAYVMMKLMPGSADMTFSEMCGHDTGKMVLYVFFALCVLLPSLYQLAGKIRKK